MMKLLSFGVFAASLLCGGAALAAPTAPAVPTTHAAPAAPVAPAAPPPAAPVTAPKAAVAAVMPDKVDPKFASLSAGKAREKTCEEQYKTNKTSGGNGGMKWIQKGGGYYSTCNKHLKAV